MKKSGRILYKAVIASAFLVVAVLLEILLSYLFRSRITAPLEVLPILAVLFLVTTRLGFLYGLPILALFPLFRFVVIGIPIDPTDTGFILSIIMTVQMLMFIVVSGLAVRITRNRYLVPAFTYIMAQILTFLSLKYGLFPFLPLLSLPTILMNYLLANVYIAGSALILFEITGMLLGEKAEDK